MQNQLKTIADVVDIWRANHDPTSPGYAALLQVKSSIGTVSLTSVDAASRELLEDQMFSQGEESPGIVFDDMIRAWEWCVKKGHLSRRWNSTGILFKTIYTDWLATLDVKAVSKKVYLSHLERCDQGFTIEEACQVPSNDKFPGSKAAAAVWRRVLSFADETGLANWTPVAESSSTFKASPAIPTDRDDEQVSITLYLEPDVWQLVTNYTGKDLFDSASGQYLNDLVLADVNRNAETIARADLLKRKNGGDRPSVSISFTRGLLRRMKERRGLFTAADYITTLLRWDSEKAPEAFTPEPVSDEAVTAPVVVALTADRASRKEKCKTQASELGEALNLRPADIMSLAVSLLHRRTFGAEKKD